MRQPTMAEADAVHLEVLAEQHDVAEAGVMLGKRHQGSKGRGPEEEDRSSVGSD